MNKAKLASILRKTRKIHRISAINLFILLLIISISGILLGWKKNSNGLILPETKKGKVVAFSKWLSLDSLENNAKTAFLQYTQPELPIDTDRIDVRPDKGIAKFTFKGGYWEVQVEGATGKVLQVSYRWSDLIENIHDGSIFDKLLGTGNIIKLLFTSIAGLSLLVFIASGVYLWYGMKMIKKSNLKNRGELMSD